MNATALTRLDAKTQWWTADCVSLYQLGLLLMVLEWALFCLLCGASVLLSGCDSSTLPFYYIDECY